MKYKIAFIAIIVIASLVRFIQLGQNPPSLYWDEVALGYNAYSITKTGKDETGRFLPLQYFQSFGDYKPPVYIYSAVPGIALFGLSEWTTRLPSALAGVFTVSLTYFLTKLIIEKAQQEQYHKKPLFHFLSKNTTQLQRSQLNAHLLALIAAFLLAISPWHIQISRVAYEANIGTFLTVLGIYSFLRGVYGKGRWLMLSSTSFALTLYTFNSNRVFTPLIVFLLTILFVKKLFKTKNKILWIATSLIVGIVLVFPLVPHLLSKEGQLRYKEVNIFSNPRSVEKANERIERSQNALWAKIFNNWRIYYAQDWLSGYFSHFQADFLFISGDVNPRFSSGDTGQLYLIYLPFLIFGSYHMVVSKRKEYYLVLFWLALAPVPAAFAREVPHALRILHILPTFEIIASIGFVSTLNSITNHKFQIKILPDSSKITTGLLTLVTSFLLLGQLIYFLYNYYTYYPKDFYKEWQYGYKQMVNELVKLQDNYDRVIITDALGRAYINVAFYQIYPPEKFQQLRQVKTDDLGFGFIEVKGFDKYEFRGINWRSEIIGLDARQTGLVVCIPAECEIGKFTKAVVNGLQDQTVFIINEIPKGVEAWTELGVFRKED